MNDLPSCVFCGIVAGREPASVIVAMHGPTEPTPALSYAVCRQLRRRGFAAEALDAICRYAFSELGSRELIARTHLHNHPSASLLVQLGFLHRGVVSVTDGERDEFRLTAIQTGETLFERYDFKRL